MKRILINATQEEELRVAMVDGQKLYDLDIELQSRVQNKNNIYKGKISRIEPSLDAVFIDFGSERNGFLSLREISKEYFLSEPIPGEKQDIKKLLKEGQEIVVQVTKEERGSKGAALTTYISLAGRFIVLMPNSPKGGGVSKKIRGKERDHTLKSLNSLEIPADMGLIIRTAGIERSEIELQWDLKYLLGIWNSIKKVAVKVESPSLIFQESNLIVRAMRDHLDEDIGEIIIDDENTYQDAKKYLKQVTPNSLKKLSHYKEDTPLFTRFQIENQIESAYSNKVNLLSGGSIVIDYTEALVSIDINSGKSTKQSDIESTALKTNVEAAEEIARQCKLRDLGGLLVIDFIDMRQYRNKRQVESTLKDAVKQDRARISIGNISKFGLLEMSRQRLRPSLGESAYKNCPKCSGMGKVRSTESLALSVLRLIEEEARKENTASVIADIPPDSATYLLNEKKQWIKDIEKREGINIILIADSETLGGNFTIKRLKADEVNLPEYKKASYKLGKTLREDIDSTINHINQNKFRNSNPHPLTAWEVDDIKAPNLMDRFMFWLLNNKKNTIKPKQRTNKPQAKTRQKNIHQEKRRRPNNKKQSPKKPSPKKPSPKKPSPRKPSPKKTPIKKTSSIKETKKKPVKKKAVKKDTKNKSVEKTSKKAAITKIEKNATKTKADQGSEPKQPITDQSLSKDKVAKSKDNQNEKLLPWEDIIPPRK